MYYKFLYIVAVFEVYGKNKWMNQVASKAFLQFNWPQLFKHWIAQYTSGKPAALSNA